MGTLEAITRSVPLIGISVFGDQRANKVRAVLSGCAVLIDFNNITTESLTCAIQETIELPN
jgi:UDP:flavonoid glycosyltransferase YjiC (YdhE family)